MADRVLHIVTAYAENGSLQQLIARTDFIKSVLRLRPWDIALRPPQLFFRLSGGLYLPR